MLKPLEINCITGSRFSSSKFSFYWHHLVHNLVKIISFLKLWPESSRFGKMNQSLYKHLLKCLRDICSLPLKLPSKSLSKKAWSAEPTNYLWRVCKNKQGLDYRLSLKQSTNARRHEMRKNLRFKLRSLVLLISWNKLRMRLIKLRRSLRLNRLILQRWRLLKPSY